MGQFSWICSDTRRELICYDIPETNTRTKKAFLLIPKEFGGGCYKVDDNYDGYGCFYDDNGKEVDAYEVAEQHPDLKQFLELANQRENELVEENKRLLDEVNGFRNVVKQNVKTVETLNDLIDVQDKKLTEANELKSEIELMKKVIIALAKITVTPGFNCTYPENNKFYNLVAKMKKT